MAKHREYAARLIGPLERLERRTYGRTNHAAIGELIERCRTASGPASRATDIGVIDRIIADTIPHDDLFLGDWRRLREEFGYRKD